MRAIAFHRHGEVEELVPVELPTPEPGPGELRVRVRACALNHLDLWVRKGWPQLVLPLPHVLGSDVAGEVEALGPGVVGPAVGTAVVVAPGLSCNACRACLAGRDHHCSRYRVIGEHLAGGYAEYVCVPASNVVPAPKGMPFERAACLPLTFLTAWGMLVERARVQPGETVLVHAAGSGVGVAAVQLAKLLGATVIATAGSPEKLERALALGADHAIDYERQDFLAETKRLTGRELCDVVVEHTGAATWERSLLCLKLGGRLVVCGATTGSEVKVDLKRLFMKRQSLLGSTMASRSALFDLVRFVEQGRLRPVLDVAMPLSDARQAHRRIAARSQFGKVVLIP